MAADASWTFDPGALALVGLAAAAYVPRWRRVRAQHGPRAAPVGRLVAFAAGLLALIAALISPIDRLGEQSFAMHMVQHILLLDVVPILLIVSLTKVILRPATRRLQRLERSAGPLAHPAAAVVLYVGVMWGWHIPALYDAALRHPLVHALEHTFFMTAGVLYWWHLMSPIRSRARLTGMGPVLYMLSTKVLVGILGIAHHLRPRRALRLLRGPGADLGPQRGRRPGAGRGDHGPRAVDRHGHRARLALRPRPGGVRVGRAARRALRA